MTKHILQTKSFLPMVIQKSTSDAVQNFDVCLGPAEKFKKVVILQPKENNKIEDVNKPTLHSHVEIPRSLTVEREYKHTILRAFILDMFQVQDRLLMLALRCHMWLRTLSLRNKHYISDPTGLLWLEGRPLLKEEEPQTTTTVTPAPERPTKRLSQTNSYKPEKVESAKKDIMHTINGMKSNVWETVQVRSPMWQRYIASRLGALHKALVQKLS